MLRYSLSVLACSLALITLPSPLSHARAEEARAVSVSCSTFEGVIGADRVSLSAIKIEPLEASFQGYAVVSRRLQAGTFWPAAAERDALRVIWDLSAHGSKGLRAFSVSRGTKLIFLPDDGGMRQIEATSGFVIPTPLPTTRLRL